MVREIRYLEDQAILRNDDPDSKTIKGYALVFNRESRDLGGFTETILPEAIEGLFPNQDILALYNHDESRGVLARYTNGEGSLTLEVDEIGLRYEFEADENSPLAMEVLSAIKRGDINTSSFAFTLEEDSWEKRSDNTYLRTIKKFKNLFDVSPVLRAAYPQTSVAMRKLEELKESEKEAMEKADEEAKSEELKTYFEELGTNIGEYEKGKES